MKPFISAKEVIEKQGEGRKSYTFLSEENGCVNGCRSGVTIYSDYEYSPKPGVHDDQEGFYVLEGEGSVKLGDEEFPVKAGDSFIALPGVSHTLKTTPGCEPVKVFWFHSGV